ncbi:Os03g0600701 [Oryza sativa Japonica Group]|uniref:Os03g0600701 protein n=1 Tax=Oryza sativa subsp. japonica TaxID=39947 RepID=A0A0P0VZZ5_ORYSJ|nr:Os03g0600701 [Oryza sativa Japonica Group]
MGGGDRGRRCIGRQWASSVVAGKTAGGEAGVDEVRGEGGGSKRRQPEEASDAAQRWWPAPMRAMRLEESRRG